MEAVGSARVVLLCCSHGQVTGHFQQSHQNERNEELLGGSALDARQNGRHREVYDQQVQQRSDDPQGEELGPVWKILHLADVVFRRSFTIVFVQIPYLPTVE